MWLVGLVVGAVVASMHWIGIVVVSLLYDRSIGHSWFVVHATDFKPS